MKKTFLIFISLFFLVLILGITKPLLADPSLFWWDVYFDRQFFDSNYPLTFERTRIGADALAQNLTNPPNQYEGLLSWGINTITLPYVMPYSGMYEVYSKIIINRNKPSTFNPDPYDGIQYTFELKDKITSLIVDTEYYTPPEDRFAELGFAVPNFIGNSTVTWNSVTPHADGTIRYRLRLQNLDSDGWPAPGFVFETPNLTTTSFTFTDPLPGPGPYAVRLEVREYFGGNLSQYVNRSVYFTEHEIEPIPEPATMLLLGSGLLGLAGLRKKFKK